MARGAPGVIVAIDGPAGAGKSTVARELAARLGLTLIDTGAIYRTAAFAAKERGIALDDDAKLATLLPALAKDLSFGAGGRIDLAGRDVSALIRSPEMSQAASAISARPVVRDALLGLQQRLGRSAPAPGAVLEGRDIGTVVFPDAEAKFFLTASPQVRAERRYLELKARGMDTTVGAVLHDQEKRDRDDSTRAVAPLKQAADAVLIDSTALDLAHVVERITIALHERKLV
jgi:cytidylate kinase